MEFPERLFRYLPQGAGFRFLITGSEIPENIPSVIPVPIPDRSLFRIIVGGHFIDVNTITVSENMFAHGSPDHDLLPSLLRSGKHPRLDRKGAERLNDIPGSISPGAPGFAREAFSATPDFITAEKAGQHIFIVSLNHLHYLTGIIFRNTGRRACGGACPATDARLQSFLVTDIILQTAEQTQWSRLVQVQ